MRLRCLAVRVGLTVVEPGASLTAPLERHVAVCLRCQAERARHRRLRRELAELRHRVASAPVRLDPPAAAGSEQLFERVPLRPRRTPRGVGAVAGVAAVVAGGAVYAAWRIARRPV